MQKSIINRIVLAFLVVPMLIVAQTSVNVPWTGTPGEMENFIHGDTTSTGEQANDIYVLEANRVYLQLSEVNMNSSMELVGADYGDGVPATVQPIAGDDGNLQFGGWPQNHSQNTSKTHRFLYFLVICKVPVIFDPLGLNSNPMESPTVWLK